MPGVEVTVRPNDGNRAKAKETVLRTGATTAGTREALPPDTDGAWLQFEKGGYISQHTEAAPGDKIVLSHKVDWGVASMLPYRDGDGVDQGLREILTSAEWEIPVDEDKLLGFLFRHQDRFRPALRRLVRDTLVGARARDWLDLLDDPGDRDLFTKGRSYAPGKEIKETDLVEALKATAPAALQLLGARAIDQDRLHRVHGRPGPRLDPVRDQPGRDDGHHLAVRLPEGGKAVGTPLGQGGGTVVRERDGEARSGPR